MMAKIRLTLLFLAVLGTVYHLVDGSSIPLPTPRGPSKSTGKVCTVTPLGPGNDDVPQILRAFDACNNGGTVVFPPGQTFYIATKLNPVLFDVTIEWKGVWKV